MPAQYDRLTSTYRVSCTRCHTSVTTGNPWSREASTTDGAQVADTFRWHSGSNRFLSRCRECERAARIARPRRSTRVPGMSANPLGIARKFGVEFECAA